MKRLIPIILLLFAMAGTPALAQESDAFFNVLRSNLSGEVPADAVRETPEIRAERTPALGESVSFGAPESARNTVTASGPYVAGRDTVSGPVAAAAVLLAAVVLVLAFLLATSRTRAED